MTSKIASKYGAFSDVGFLSSGEPYNDKDPLRHGNSRYKGLNMKAMRCKTGKTNDAAFDRLKPLYEKEKYAGVMTLEERRAAREAREAGRIQPPLKPPSKPRTRTTGLGSYDGAIGPKYAHVPQTEGETPKVKGDYPEVPRNITVAPGKKGSYGTRGTTLGGAKGTGVCGEYAYVGDDYDAARKLARERAAAGKKKEQSNPFKPSAPGKKGGAGTRGTTLGGPKGTGVCGEYAYKPEGPEARPEREELDKPWRPSKPNRGPINKPAKYVEDPAELKEAKAREARELAAELAPEKPFVPNGKIRTGATRSIVRMNL